MNLDLEELPSEILLEILTYLEPRDLAQLARTSARFNGLADDFALWTRKINEKFGCEEQCRCYWEDAEGSEEGEGEEEEGKEPQQLEETGNLISPKLVYFRFLSKLGHSLGLWRKQHHKGYLMKIRLERGALIGFKIRPPQQLKDSLVVSTLFSARLDAKAGIVYKSLHAGKEVPDRRIEVKLAKDAHSLTLFTQNNLRASSIWLNQGSITPLLNRDDTQEVFHRCNIPSHPDHYLHPFPPCVPSFPRVVQAGIYKGTYRNEGVELVHVFYDLSHGETPCIRGVKLTGDTYVPAGETTFEVELSSPLHPTSSQMRRMGALKLTQVCQDLGCLCPNTFPPQSFRIPMDCRVDVAGFAYPDRASFWFNASHVIAYPNFTRPARILAHFVAFSPTEFGLLSFQLNDRTVFNSLSLFLKVDHEAPL